MTLSKYFLAAALVTALGAGPVLAQAPDELSKAHSLFGVQAACRLVQEQ